MLKVLKVSESTKKFVSLVREIEGISIATDFTSASNTLMKIEKYKGFDLATLIRIRDLKARRISGGNGSKKLS